MRHRIHILPFIAAATLAASGPAAASPNEIGFNERFALSADRSKTLSELIPGTEDYFFYNCLQAQNTGQLEAGATFLKQWSKQLGEGDRYRVIERRQALLSYDKNPQAALSFLRDRLDLTFNHQRETADPTTSYPTVLDQAQIGRGQFKTRALASSRSLAGIEDSGLETMVVESLTKEQRRDLLDRLPRPDVKGIETLVLAELKEPDTRGFGRHQIHRKLTLAQLDAVRAGDPDLAGNSVFVDSYARRLAPSPDTDWRADVSVRGDYLNRLWSFAAGLPSSQNSFKACVLYRLLEHERAQGIYSRDHFTTYLQLPRAAPYVNRQWAAQSAARREPAASLSQSFAPSTGLDPVVLDESLVREYLEFFLVNAPDASAFKEWIDDNYLKQVLAETKILCGVGDPAAWSSILAPAQLQDLKDRVEINFTPRNPEFHAPDANVVLEAAVKNVPRLTIKVFDLDAGAYYRERASELDARIDLDGLVANSERTVEYKDIPSSRRHVETFKFPELAGQGAYVVELVGNGVSSRALVRKGRLRFIERRGAAGHTFTIFDSAGNKVEGASLWISGHEFKADDDGTVTVPFSTTDSGAQSVVISKDRLSSLAEFRHQAERYELRVGTILDRESLLAGEKASVVICPLLLCNGRPADISLLEEPVIEITTFDVEGIGSAQRRDGPVFKNGEDFVHSFKVPARTVSVTLTLSGKVRNLSMNRDDSLSDRSTLELNGILSGPLVSDLFLRRVAGGYLIESRGRNGEVLAGRPVNLSFKHRLFREPIRITLQTDADGRIVLGPLPDIVVVGASSAEASQVWQLKPRAGVVLPAAMHIVENSVLTLPAVDMTAAGLEDQVSLLGVTSRGDPEYTADFLEKASVKDGRLTVSGLPPGDYRLALKRTGETIVLRVARAVPVGTTLVGDVRILEATAARPLQIGQVRVEGADLVIHLDHASEQTRVHVVARRMMSDTEPWDTYLAGVPPMDPSLLSWLNIPAAYVSGRSIGDEARYVLERRYARRFAGNMLERPGLILNPWSMTTTETTVAEAVEGEDWAAPGSPVTMRGMYGGRAAGARGEAGGGQRITSLLDFLPAPARVWANLRPSPDGLVKIPAAELGDRNEILAVAADASAMAWRGVSLEEGAWPTRDLRLSKSLDSSVPLTEKKTSTAVRTGESFTVNDIEGARMESYDTLAKMFRLFQTLSPDPVFAEFAFLTEWPDLPAERKQALYSKYACHELNFFLHGKDRAFFDKTVAPALSNKRDRTFMDDWLLGADLTRYIGKTELTRLNALERTLLARRIASMSQSNARYVDDMADLVPHDPDAFERRFLTALQSGQLDETGLAAGGAAKGMPDGTESVPREEQNMPKPAAVMAPGFAAVPPAGTKGSTQTFDAPAKQDSDKSRSLGEMKEAENKLAEKAAMEPARDAAKRRRLRQFYRSPEQTREWVETQYYRVPRPETGPDLIPVNGFWRDFAAHDGKTPFLSAHIDEACGSIAERICAMAVIDLPFKAMPVEETVQGPRRTCKLGSPAVIYHQQVSKAGDAKGDYPLMVAENFFDLADRWRQVGSERVEKYVREEFVAGRVYGAQAVLTNPSGARRKVSLLTQIPEGAMPVLKGLPTRSTSLELDPYFTRTIEYHFYFPATGDFNHYPATVSQDQVAAGMAKPLVCHVVARPTIVDRASWAFVSQNGSEDDVLAYLRNRNVHSGEVALERIAWRMSDRRFFNAALAVLDERNSFDPTLWSYAVKHGDARRVREYLAIAQPDFVRSCGMWLQSPLLDVDAEALATFEYREYWPMVNARAHQLGKERTIQNSSFLAQYNRFTDYLDYRPDLGPRERLAVTVYMLLQDRADEAMTWFDTVRPDDAATKMQADYIRAYLAFSRGEPADAARIAAAYADFPVDRWRERFRNVVAQADEIRGASAVVSDEDKRQQVQDQLASEAPSLTIAIEGQEIQVSSRNIESCEIRLFPLDIELLFSRQPFLGDEGARPGYVRPARTEKLRLGKGELTRATPIPAEFSRRNVLVEVAADGLSQRVSYTPRAMNSQVIANYGQVRVRTTDKGRPVAGAYAKVYARMSDGSVKFYKDGYTDLRGIFDYASISTGEIDRAIRFAILILDDKMGAQILEAAPPKR